MSQRRVLIISYYWPPAGGPGVQRWLKFTKYLPYFGWKPIVFIPENPSYPLLDESLSKDIPNDLEIIKTKIWEPYQLAEKLSRNNRKFKAGQLDVSENQSWKAKLSIWIRGNFFIPDARVFWVKPSIKYLKKYLKENQIDCLVTTGPPHSLHLIGLGVKNEFPNLKWIADFRDPWTEISYYKHLKLTKWADQRHKVLEERVFKTADITLATSFTDAENFRKKGANSVCITNGFDEDEVKFESQKTEKFTLSYIGVLEQLRNPENLWLVLEELVKENPDFYNNFELKIVGKIDDRILEKINKTRLKNNLKNLGYLPHHNALEEMKNTDILLITNFDQDSSKGIIPGKLFEYLATGKQIISIGPKDSDVAKILAETLAGKHFTYRDKDELKFFILKLYREWKEGEIQANTKGIEQYSRKNLTLRLVNIL